MSQCVPVAERGVKDENWEIASRFLDQSRRSRIAAVAVNDQCRFHQYRGRQAADHHRVITKRQLGMWPKARAARQLNPIEIAFLDPTPLVHSRVTHHNPLAEPSWLRERYLTVRLAHSPRRNRGE